jgi:hypothetical protein
MAAVSLQLEIGSDVRPDMFPRSILRERRDRNQNACSPIDSTKDFPIWYKPDLSGNNKHC